MIQAYLNERYQEGLEIDWNHYLVDNGLTCYMTGFGFVTYKLQGDSVLLYDLYVKPEYRKHTYSRVLFDMVVDIGQKADKRCCITFSQFIGKNHLAGIRAMNIAGFVPAFKTDEEFVFLRGI